MEFNAKYWVRAGIIAAVYAVVTIIAAPISYGLMQVRVSEAITILPALTSAGIPGLFVGCLISNLIGPLGIVDVVCGSIATLLGAIGTRMLKDKPLLMPLPPVIINGVVIGAMLKFFYGINVNLFVCMAWVGFGELIACYVIGLPLYYLLKKYERFFD